MGAQGSGSQQRARGSSCKFHPAQPGRAQRRARSGSDPALLPPRPISTPSIAEWLIQEARFDRIRWFITILNRSQQAVRQALSGLAPMGRAMLLHPCSTEPV